MNESTRSITPLHERFGQMSVYTATVLTLADIISHVHDITVAHEPIWQAYPFRNSIPIVSEQIGNAGPSIAVVFFGTVIGNELSLYAEKAGNERLMHLAEKALPISTVTAIGLNILSEWGGLLHENIRRENALDFGFGMFCVGLGVLAAQHFKNACPEGIWHNLSLPTRNLEEMVECFYTFYVR